MNFRQVRARGSGPSSQVIEPQELSRSSLTKRVSGGQDAELRVASIDFIDETYPSGHQERRIAMKHTRLGPIAGLTVAVTAAALGLAGCAGDTGGGGATDGP